MSNILDIILTILLVALVFRGFLRGFVKEFFFLGTWAIGLLGAFLFYKQGGEFIRTQFSMEIPGLPEILGFIAIFLIVFLVCKFVRKILSDIINGMKLTSIDKLLGGIFGFVEGAVIVAAVLFVINLQSFVDLSGYIKDSLYGTLLLPLLPRLLDYIPKELPAIPELPNTSAFLFFRTGIFRG